MRNTKSRLGRVTATRVIALLIALAMTATACGGGSSGVETADASSSSTDDVTSVEPTAVPEPEPTEVPPEPTPTPTPIPEPTPTPGPDFDGDGTPDDADDDDDNDGVPDDADDFPFNPERYALLASQFALIDGVAQLPDTPSTQAIRWIQEQFGAETTTVEQVQERFAPSFLAQFSPSQVVDFIDTQRQVRSGFEPLDARVVSEYFAWVNMGSPQSPAGGSGRLLRMGVDPNTGQIKQFGIRPSVLGIDPWIFDADRDFSIAEAVEQLGTKAPNTSVLVAEVTDDGCSVIAGKDETVKRGIASIFKAWVLGALAGEVDAGTIARDEIITITPGEYIAGGSAATGEFASPMDLTVQQVANLMMNVSDNGATDTMHQFVGRDILDAYVQASGHTDPDALTPLLTLSEFNNLYGNVTLGQTQAYLTMDEVAQADFVTNVLEPLGVWTTNQRGNPELTQDLSWQAAPIDVCNNMANLRMYTPESEAGMLIDEAYGGEAALFGLRSEWDRVWYKGGGHPSTTPGGNAVLTHGWMVESNDGRAYAVITMLNTEGSVPNDPVGFELQSLHSQIMKHLAAGTGF